MSGSELSDSLHQHRLWTMHRGDADYPLRIHVAAWHALTPVERADAAEMLIAQCVDALGPEAVRLLPGGALDATALLAAIESRLADTKAVVTIGGHDEVHFDIRRLARHSLPPIAPVRSIHRPCGRAARRSTNARRRGSRRASRAGPSDEPGPGEPGDPAHLAPRAAA